MKWTCRPQLLSHKNAEVPILQQQACISAPRTFFWLTFSTSVDLLWSGSLRLMPCVKTLWSFCEELSSTHLHFIGISMRKEWMTNNPADPRGPFLQEIASSFSKVPWEGPPFPNLSTLRSGLEMWSHSPASLNSWTLPLRTRTVKWVNEPRHTHQESRRRPFSVASHEHLQPAFPQEQDLCSRPPHQQPSSPSCYGSGGAKHSRSDLTSQCSANFSQPNQLD